MPVRFNNYRVRVNPDPEEAEPGALCVLQAKHRRSVQVQVRVRDARDRELLGQHRRSEGPSPCQRLIRQRSPRNQVQRRRRRTADQQDEDCVRMK